MGWSIRSSFRKWFPMCQCWWDLHRTPEELLKRREPPGSAGSAACPRRGRRMRPLCLLPVADPARLETVEKIPLDGDNFFALGARGCGRSRVWLLKGQKPTMHLGCSAEGQP